MWGGWLWVGPIKVYRIIGRVYNYGECIEIVCFGFLGPCNNDSRLHLEFIVRPPKNMTLVPSIQKEVLNPKALRNSVLWALKPLAESI